MQRLFVTLILIFAIAQPAFAAQSKAKKTASFGKWQYSSITDSLDDTKEYHLTIKADSGTNRLGKPITMQFYCAKDASGLTMQWNEYIAGDITQVMMRYDKGEAESTNWMVDRQHIGAFYHGSDSMNDMLRKISKANTLTTQVDPYMEPPLIAIFDVRKLAVALDRLKSKCPMIDLTEPAEIPDEPTTESISNQPSLPAQAH